MSAMDRPPANLVTMQEPTTLLEWLLHLTADLNGVFSQQRTFHRASRLLFSCMLTVGRGWITRWLSSTGRGDVDWSADFRVFSRSPWNSRQLFKPIIERTLAMNDDPYIVVGLDETFLMHAGRRFDIAAWLRDPQSPKFWVNLTRGIPMLHAVIPLRDASGNDPRPRAISIAFEPRPSAKKPRNTKKHPATDEELSKYREQQKINSPSVKAIELSQWFRETCDELGTQEKRILLVVDGSYCNGRFLSGQPERVSVVARARKDAKLCLPAKPESGSRRVYDKATFTPEQVRQNDAIPWKTATFGYGGAWRDLEYKEVDNVLWRTATKRLPLRLIVVRATPYSLSKNGRQLYRDPSYLLTNDLSTPAKILVQAYLDRWQIEVTHRELKTSMGVADAQVFSKNSVGRQPAFVAAAYSLLMLAGHLAYGPKRTNHYEPLPKWRRNASRPSCLDLLTQLRKEVEERPDLVEPLGIKSSPPRLVRAAAG